MMIAEVTQVQEQLQEKWFIFWWALSMGLLVLAIAKSRGLFNPFTASPFPLIRGIDVLRGFGFFLFMELLLIPALAIQYLP